MFGLSGKNWVYVLDPVHGLLHRVALRRFSEEYPGVDLRPFVDRDTGRQYLYAFTQDMPTLDRIDMSDKYWQKLTKWLLAAPSPSARFPMLLVIGISLVVGFFLGLAL